MARERKPPSRSKPKTPTVEEQIESAKAPKGSALEKLIRANQEFELLHPDEFEDDYPVPLWLRVAWRKEHPEVQMPAENPGAAYPEVLSQAYRRMVADPDGDWGSDTTATGGTG
jgi:hypothetical protein